MMTWARAASPSAASWLLNGQQCFRSVDHGAHPLGNGKIQLSPDLAHVDSAYILDDRGSTTSAGPLERHEEQVFDAQEVTPVGEQLVHRGHLARDR